MAEQSGPDLKYPRTPHFPFSPGRTDDDVVLEEVANIPSFPLLSKEVVVTEKLDGGNCCISRGKVYARTLNSEATHPSFGPIKRLASQISYQLSDNLQLFGENLYGIHSIEYDELESFFYLFAVLRDRKCWLSWSEVCSLADELGIPTVPVVYTGRFTSFKEYEDLILPLMKNRSKCGSCTPEGFVVRTLEGFSYERFDSHVAKFVRRGHIQTDETWRRTWRAAKLK
jgi:hypothetical protein